MTELPRKSIEKKRDDALARALATPHKPHKPLKKAAKKAKRPTKKGKLNELSNSD
jgi:hypothetical protein